MTDDSLVLMPLIVAVEHVVTLLWGGIIDGGSLVGSCCNDFCFDEIKLV